MQRPKRDERGRRFGGEWDKRLEIEGKSLVTNVNEKGGEPIIEQKYTPKMRKKTIADDNLTTTTLGETMEKHSPLLVKKQSQSTKSRRSSKSHRSRRRHRRRLFSEPNLGTLERFEKVSQFTLVPSISCILVSTSTP
jgi:hypothetical protein